MAQTEMSVGEVLSRILVVFVNLRNLLLVGLSHSLQPIVARFRIIDRRADVLVRHARRWTDRR